MKKGKNTIKTLYRLNPEVNTMTFNNSVETAYHKTISENTRNKNRFC
ncbi:Hypothetical protein PAU_03197 [Photorhabdus asymbiotica]|uniref:Uncharacterized protein n=1 Tax=Photorhabdus asymbiotica subsp. asymbiotica (strain ATCC 43949 / 3105-77) TaxID=553480 RepID=C7BHB9_PHOAA|nr:Hypothetical protein PAU_03197 [Photorhabdus asymbiotica]